jgi:membrane-associated phospholipid phosphatase
MTPSSLLSKATAALKRFSAFWSGQHRTLFRLGSLTFLLLAFIAWLPTSIRSVFWTGLQNHKILAGLLLVFCLLAISLVGSTGQKLDSWAFLVFNLRGPRPIWLDRVMLGFTQIGNGLIAVGTGLILFLAGVRLLASELMLGTLTLWIVVELVKFFVHRSRPFLRHAQARIVGLRALGRSFPSGHTSQAFFLATLTIQHFHASPWVAFPLYTAALLVGFTRMYVGAHYPRDVAAGAILGSAWGLLVGIANGYVLSEIG